MAGGRKSKYTPTTVARICEAIGKGATYTLAAAYGGIDDSTFRRWMGEKDAFCAAVKAAEAQAVARWLDVIDAAAHEGNWQAAAWKLERRHPDDYGRRERQQHEISGTIQTQVSFVNDWRASATTEKTDDKTEGEA